MRQTGGQRRTRTDRLERLQNAVMIAVLVADQHVIRRHRAFGVADTRAFQCIVGWYRADAGDALRIARAAEQGLDGLIPVAVLVFINAQADVVVLAMSIATIKFLQGDAITQGHHIEQQERLAGTGFVKHAVERQLLGVRVVADALTDRHR